MAAAGPARVDVAPATAAAKPAYRWVILAVVWFGYLLSFVDRLIWGNVAGGVSHSLGLPVAALGVFFTAFYVGYIVSNAVTGIGTDWLGPRLMLTTALLPLGLFTFLFSLTTSIAMGLLLQALMGLTAGADFAAGVKLILSWFGVRDRGFAMGLFMTATSLGVVVTNAVVPTLIAHLGWPAAYQIAGAVTAGFGVVCFLVLRDHPDGAPRMAARPDLAPLFHSRAFLLLTAACFCALWGTWGFAFWANALMVRGYGITPVQAGAVVATFGIGAVLGKPVIGLLSDLLGGMRKLPVILCLIGFTAALLVFGKLDALGEFRIVAPILGVFAFLYSPLLNTMIAEAVESLSGSASGIAIGISSIGVSIVPLAVGAGFAATHSFFAAFAILAAGPALAVLFLLGVPEQRRRRVVAA